MKKKSLVFLLILAVLFSAQPVLGDPLNVGTRTNWPGVNAKAFVLMDAQSGQVLDERNPNEQLAIASITKIMTGIVAIEQGNLDAEVTVGQGVLDRKRIYGTLLFLEPGEKFSLRDLLYALLMNSANDASVAVAEHIAGSADGFVKLMNDKAKDLGANDTHFTNPHGLSEVGHYSSARDMAVIARYAMQNPAFAEIVKTKEREFPRNRPGIPNTLQNHNKLLWHYPGADGVKTGYTDLAGHTLVASASRNGRQLIVVILKGTAIGEVYKDAGKLFDFGFNQFQNKLLVAQGKVVGSVQLENAKVLPLIANKDVFGTVANTDSGEFELRVEPQNLGLPVTAGEVRGRLDVYLQGKLLESVPLVAAETIGLPAPSLAGPAKTGVLWLLLILASFALLITLKRVQRRRGRRRIPRSVYRWNVD